MFVLLLFLSVSVPYLLLFSAQRYKKIPISANYSWIICANGMKKSLLAQIICVRNLSLFEKIIKLKMQTIMLYSNMKTVSLQNLSVSLLPDGAKR